MFGDMTGKGGNMDGLIRTDQAILDRLHGAEVYLGDDV